MSYINTMRINNLIHQVNEIEDSLNLLILGQTGGVVTRDIDANNFNIIELGNISFNNGEVLEGVTGSLLYSGSQVITQENLTGITGFARNPLSEPLDCNLDKLSNVQSIEMPNYLNQPGGPYRFCLYNGIPSVLDTTNPGSVYHCLTMNENSNIAPYLQVNGGTFNSVGEIEITNGGLLFGSEGQIVINWYPIITTQNAGNYVITKISQSDLNMNNHSIANVLNLSTTRFNLNSNVVGVYNNSLYVGDTGNICLHSPSTINLDMNLNNIENVNNISFHDSGNTGVQSQLLYLNGVYQQSPGVDGDNNVFITAPVNGDNEINMLNNTIMNTNGIIFNHGYSLGVTGEFDTGYLTYNNNEVLTVQGGSTGVNVKGNIINNVDSIKFTDEQVLTTDSGTLLFESNQVYTSANPPPSAFNGLASTTLNMNMYTIENCTGLNFGVPTATLELTQSGNFVYNNNEIITTANLNYFVEQNITGSYINVTVPTGATAYVFNNLPNNTYGVCNATVQYSMFAGTPPEGQETSPNYYMVAKVSFAFTFNKTTNQVMLITNSLNVEDITGNDDGDIYYWKLMMEDDITKEPTLYWYIYDNGSQSSFLGQPLKITYNYHTYP